MPFENDLKEEPDWETGMNDKMKRPKRATDISETGTIVLREDSDQETKKEGET